MANRLFASLAAIAAVIGGVSPVSARGDNASMRGGILCDKDRIQWWEADQMVTRASPGQLATIHETEG